MNTTQIKKALDSDKQIKHAFAGVFAADMIPSIVPQYPYLIVCNSDTSIGPGEHWLLIYICKDKKGIFFDSMGHSPGYYGKGCFTKFLDDNCIFWEYNKKQLQSMYSHVCGQYCLVFAYYLCRNKTIDFLVNLFHGDRIWNDICVEKFVRDHFDICTITSSKKQNVRRFNVGRW